MELILNGKFLASNDTHRTMKNHQRDKYYKHNSHHQHFKTWIHNQPLIHSKTITPINKIPVLRLTFLDSREISQKKHDDY